MVIETENYVTAGKLQIQKDLFELVKKEIAPKTGITNKNFWSSLENILLESMHKNAELLKNAIAYKSKLMPGI